MLLYISSKMDPCTHLYDYLFIFSYILYCEYYIVCTRKMFTQYYIYRCIQRLSDGNVYIYFYIGMQRAKYLQCLHSIIILYTLYLDVPLIYMMCTMLINLESLTIY